MQHRYRAFGLEIVSGIACPELRVGTGVPDVEIRLAAEGEGDTGRAGFEAAPGRFDLTVPGLARYRVEAGRTITVVPTAGADEEGVRLFLLGSAIGALLHQRGVLPLHGAAVRAGGGYVLIVGGSGNGKSSLAAALRKRGWSVGSDDISAIVPVDGRACLQPGYPESKLWPDVLKMLDDDPARFERVRPNLEKRRVPLAGFCDEPAPVDAVVVVRPVRVDAPALTPVTGGTKMAVLKRHVYRSGLSVRLGAHCQHFATSAVLAAQTPVWHLERPRWGFPLTELAAFVEQRLEAEAASTGTSE